MISLDDRKKIIEYLKNNKNKLKDVLDDYKLALIELETENIQEVLTKKRLVEIISISILFIRFIKAISETFEIEE